MADEIPRDAYAIIIGSMKCGTSSLYSYLANHPEICPCKVKEPEFFSEKQWHGKKVAYYHDLWTFDRSIHKYALEASTGYTKYPAEKNVPKNIHGYGILPKFIYIIRNPFDRIASHYNFKKEDDSWHLTIDHRHLIDTTNYFLQIEKFKQYFPIDDFLLLDFDELKEHPSRIMKRIYTFLNLSEIYYPANYEIKNPTRINSRFGKSINQTRLKYISNMLPHPMKIQIKKVLGWWYPPEKRELTDQEKENIFKELQKDMISLRDVYGFNVSKWGFG